MSWHSFQNVKFYTVNTFIDCILTLLIYSFIPNFGCYILADEWSFWIIKWYCCLLAIFVQQYLCHYLNILLHFMLLLTKWVENGEVIRSLHLINLIPFRQSEKLLYFRQWIWRFIVLIVLKLVGILL